MAHIIDEIGGPAAVARMVGCKPPSVVEWRKRGIPAERCPTIEKKTGGRYVCEQLCNNVVWHRVPDPAWPWHPAGRPLIDVTQPTPAPAGVNTQETRDAA